MLAVQLPVANAVVRGRKKPDISLIVKAVSVTVRHLTARGQIPNSVSDRDIVARFIPHGGRKVSKANHIAERDLFIPDVISIFAEE